MDQINKPKFSLLVVDDEPDAVDTDLSIAKGVVESAGHEFVLHQDFDGKGVSDILQKHMIDVIATDKNILTEDDGIEVVTKIRASHPYVDIIFYSGQGITLEERAQLDKFAFIEIVDDKDISNQLSTVIKRNLSKWDDISYLRGIVISLIINLEQMINEFILKHYRIHSEATPSFIQHVLDNRYFSFEGKKWILSKVINKDDYPGLLTKLGDLQCARNELAHSKLANDEKNCLVIDGTNELLDKTKVEGYYKKGKDAAELLKKLIDSS